MTEEAQSRTYKREAIRGLPLLKLLDDAVFDQVLRASKAVSVAKHSTVVGKGVQSDWLGFLLSGRIQVVDSLSNGIEVGLNVINPGQFFGELAVIDRQPRSASLVAMAACDILMVPGDVARQLFFKFPAVAEAVLAHFSHVIRRTNQLRSLLSIPSAYQRLYALLDYLKTTDAGGLVVLEPLLTHQELAIMINTTRETVSRAMSKLAALRVVERDHTRLIIRSPTLLHKLASADAPEKPLDKAAES